MLYLVCTASLCSIYGLQTKMCHVDGDDDDDDGEAQWISLCFTLHTYIHP